jgi:hypothetical protein
MQNVKATGKAESEKAEVGNDGMAAAADRTLQIFLGIF